jgi:hypothetical protein|tara:strand:- start:1143 stop:1685 length:543 start_codon:yes stop_codon:yes gene_type:complete
MAEGTLSILLRDGTHASAAKRLALKCENITVNIGRTPIQVPIPTNSPYLIDLGIVRPTISVSGLVDNIGGDTSNTTSVVGGMSSFSYNDGSSSQTYYIPYKNFLEEFCCEEMYSDDNLIQIQIGDTTRPLYTSSTNFSTGGATYHVAIQSANFTQTPGLEDRWQFAIQFVSKTASHIDFA